jgi:hypothetical protein
LFTSIRDEWKPEVLTAWQREMKVTDAASVTNVLDADPVRAFIHYPLDMKPAPIGTKLPPVWKAPDLGYYAFRSGWDENAFIAQVFTKNQVISGWNGENAGTYRLRGLGQNWATGSDDRVRQRQQENVVWMPDANLAEGGLGRITYLKTESNTMVLSVNLDDVYESAGRIMYSRYGHLRRPALPTADTVVPEPSGITGMRSLAFDYSGASGAPCLFVVVDKINGGKGVKRWWLMQPPGADKPLPKGAKPGPSNLVTPTDKGFTITPPGTTSTLRGVFAHPPEIQVGTDPIIYEYTKNFGKGQGQKIRVTINALRVPGQDHFFFVGTVSPGQQPPVQVQGQGLDSVFTVGKRTIRFDGEKIVLGTK